MKITIIQIFTFLQNLKFFFIQYGNNVFSHFAAHCCVSTPAQLSVVTAVVLHRLNSCTQEIFPLVNSAQSSPTLVLDKRGKVSLSLVILKTTYGCSSLGFNLHTHVEFNNRYLYALLQCHYLMFIAARNIVLPCVFTFSVT